MILLSLASALLAQAAPAPPEWRPVGVSANGRETFFDPASIVRGTPVSRVRVRFSEQNGYVLSPIEIRCALFEARIMGTTGYDAQGVERNRNEMATPFRAIVAGSFLEALAREVCGTVQGPAQPS